MSRYFTNFPKTAYSFNDGASVDVVNNLTVKVGFSSEFKNESSVYEEYLISDGDTPESIAYKLYGISERHWIILSYNDIMDPLIDWPIEGRALHNIVDNKYSSVAYANTANTGISGSQWAKQNVKEYYKTETYTELTTHVKTENKIVINYSDYANLTSQSVTYTLKDGSKTTKTIDRSYITYYDYEFELNDKKRLIKIPKNEFINAIETEFNKLVINE